MRMGEMTTDSPELTDAERIEIGASMRLNVGPINETLKDPEGNPALKIRDDLGLLIDPKLYVKKHCSNCGGNATYQVSNAVRVPGARSSRNNTKTEIRTCGCVTPRYQKARRKLRAAYDFALRCCK